MINLLSLYSSDHENKTREYLNSILIFQKIISFSLKSFRVQFFCKLDFDDDDNNYDDDEGTKKMKILIMTWFRGLY